MSKAGAPPDTEAFRHRHPYAAGADAEQPRGVDNLIPGAQQHQLWDAPVSNPRSPDSVDSFDSFDSVDSVDSVERISMQPPRQRHHIIRFGDRPLEEVYRPTQLPHHLR
jgi:hypothetical protein